MRRIILMSSAAVVLPFYAWAETSNSVDEFTCTVTPDCQIITVSNVLGAIPGFAL